MDFNWALIFPMRREAESIERGVITAGFDGKPGDEGEQHLRALRPGDWVLAYASTKGYLGAGRVLADDTYNLHREVPNGSHSNHKHERTVEWVYVIREAVNAISEGVAGLYHPVRTRQRVTTKSSEIAERLISLLREQGEHLPPREPHTAINLPLAIDDALKYAEKGEEQRQPIDTENDARVRDMRAIVQRRGQSQFRESLLEAYSHRCAVTACAAVAVLEAAHIVPYIGEHANRVDSGLLLRSDIHTLFDLGLSWVDAETMQVQIADALLATDYDKYHGRALTLPRQTTDQPQPGHLRYHAKIACES